MPNAIDKLTDILGSQTKVAAALDLTVSHVSRMRNGKSPIPEPVAMLAHFLEVTPRRDWPERLRK